MLPYPWQQTILDALLASHSDLPGKIHLAQMAIAARQKEKLPTAEQWALSDALNVLRVLISECRKPVVEQDEERAS